MLTPPLFVFKCYKVFLGYWLLLLINIIFYFYFFSQLFLILYFPVFISFPFHVIFVGISLSDFFAKPRDICTNE